MLCRLSSCIVGSLLVLLLFFLFSGLFRVCMSRRPCFRMCRSIVGLLSGRLSCKLVCLGRPGRGRSPGLAGGFLFRRILGRWARQGLFCSSIPGSRVVVRLRIFRVCMFVVAGCCWFCIGCFRTRMCMLLWCILCTRRCLCQNRFLRCLRLCTCCLRMSIGLCSRGMSFLLLRRFCCLGSTMCHQGFCMFLCSSIVVC